MDTDAMTIKDMRQHLAQAEEIQKALNLPSSGQVSPAPGDDDSSHWKIGKNYFIRTVTHHLVGKLVKVSRFELVLLDAAWIPDDGRFNVAVGKGEVAEVEPFPDGELIVGRGSLIDAIQWQGQSLLRAVK
jgi:hypothetical protein